MRNLIAAALLSLLLTKVAGADTSLVATGSITTGYSNNVFGVAESDDPTALPVEQDGFVDLAPGLAAAYERRRSIHNLTYTFGARYFLSNEGANALSNSLNYDSIVRLSPVQNLRFSAGFNTGRINQLDQAGNDAVAEGDVLPAGNIRFVSYDASALYRRMLTDVWSLETSVSAAHFEPTNAAEAATTRNLAWNIRSERQFRYHLLGGDFQISDNRQEAEQIERALTFSPGFFWIWNLTDSISSNVTGGLDVVGEFSDLSNRLYVPRASAALTYSHERGRATAGWARGVATNLFGGNLTVNNQYFVNLGLPLPIRRPTGVAVDFAYATGDIINLEIGDTEGRTERMSADFSVVTEIKRAWNLGLRFETSRQEVSDIALMGMQDATIDQTLGMVILEGRFPEQIAAQVPRSSSDRVESSNADFAPEPEAPLAPGQSPE